MPKVLIYGYYGKGNLGDDLFRDAFRNLLGGVEFSFVDHLRATEVAAADAVVIGGGSLLDGPLAIDADARPLLATKRLLYVGVGGETEIHADHVGLLRGASLVAIRGPAGIDRLRALCPRVLVTPDIVYALQDHVPETSRAGVLFLPNIGLVPGGGDAHWKHAAWDYFKSETAQFIDELIDSGVDVAFTAMSRNDGQHDDFAAVEIMNKMRHRGHRRILAAPLTYAAAIGMFSRFRVVFTQRLHGAILADLARTPAVVVAHHDKLHRDGYVSYWGINKASLQNAYRMAGVAALPPSDGFDALRTAFEELVPSCVT